ncbi:sulfite exporter TauE/SafE family protein [Halomonas sp. ISL-60]|uniref:sulfite exporter TauE/SafE family protein n=1 Tax=Halomonas sp. ISL-56 TaxID=2819149 RepID=UPI001BEC827E|nr:sulfite exporter TauE/SafE family protein [Halomonas sp. ISL-56]MBT2771278.1 sulfite exporter TauE/SafE family protein [Halomonas sp. ISL-60]MBT2800635.1 sulfite exporter TauE/SafE family protein [Halomonas sp. ISL-56]
MVDFASLLAVAGTFLIAGSVKGVIGLGLPPVSLALLTVALDLPTAMALMLIPSFVTNLWQSMVGGNARAILVRLWPFLAMASLTVWVGAAALTRVNLTYLTALLGSLLIIYAVVSLAGIKMVVPSRHEVWAGPLIGSANGVLTGMTGSFAVPGVMFLQAIGLPKNMLIQAMGMLFMVSTVALAAALQQANFLSLQYGAISAAAVLPALAGMMIGQRIRARLSEQVFRKVFFISLLMLGTYIIVTAIQKL